MDPFAKIIGREFSVQFSWDQPLCREDWIVRNGNRRPVVVTTPKVERCCMCGEQTSDGIYQRIDPRTVKFPALAD